MDQAAQKRAYRLKKRIDMGEAAYKAQETAARNARTQRAMARIYRPAPAPVPVLITPAPAPVITRPVITPPERPPRRSTKEIMAIMNKKAPPVPERKRQEPEKLTSENVNDNEMISFKDVKTIITKTIKKTERLFQERINDLNDEISILREKANEEGKTDYQLSVIKEKQYYIWRTLKEMYNIGKYELEEVLSLINDELSIARRESSKKEGRNRVSKWNEERVIEEEPPTTPPSSPKMKVIRTIKNTPATQIANIEEPTPPERPPRRSTEEIMAIMNNLNKPETQIANIEQKPYPKMKRYSDEPPQMSGNPISRDHPLLAFVKPPWEDNKPMWVEPVNINIKKDVKETTLKNYMYKINSFHKKHYTGDPKNFISWVYDTSLIENINKTYDTPEQKRSLMTAILSVLSRDPEMSTHKEILEWYRTVQNIYQQQINEKKN